MGFISLEENWEQFTTVECVDAMEMTERQSGKCMNPEGCSFLRNLQASTSQQCKLLNRASGAAASKLSIGDSCQKIEHQPAKLTGWDRRNADYQVNDRSQSRYL